MIRPAPRIRGRVGAVLTASMVLLLLLGWAGGAPADAAMNCPTPSDGDVLQGPDDQTYLYTNGVLRAIPDRETLRALGFDPNGADPIRDECLRAMRFGEPIPSVGTGGQRGRSDVPAAPVPTPDPAAPTVMLDVSDARPARQTTVRLTARTDAPQGNGLVLSIHRTAGVGHPGPSGLVTTCSDTMACSVEVWEDEAVTWVYVATLYRCSAPGVCVAVQESSPVGIAWQ